MKILFAFVLCVIFMICFVIVLFGKQQNPAIIAFTPISFIAFFGYFAVQFLGLDINILNIKIRKRMLSLESNQKELRLIATTLYKFLIFFKFHTFYPPEVDKNFEIFKRLQDEIEKYIDDTSIDDLIKELEESYKKFRGE